MSEGADEKNTLAGEKTLKGVDANRGRSPAQTTAPDGDRQPSQRPDGAEVQGSFVNTDRLKPAGDEPDDPDDHSEELRRRILARIEDDAQKRGPDSLIGQELGGRFTVTKKIGEGGMGAVYRARQKGMDRDVAIKVLLKQMTENATIKRRFTLEALAVSKLKHPNTIQIFDFGETPEGELYIAMEFLEGQALQDRLHDRGALPVRSAAKIAIQLTKSLREAHGKGIVHRDLKPDNIFLTAVGEETDFVKVLDFGVAKLREADDNQGTLTKAGAVFGTPRYMSPEQGTAAGSVDHRSDLYAIGVILYEMCTGRAPFEADNALGILIKHLQDEVPTFAQVRPDLVIPGELELFIRRLLEKKPDDRPQSAEAVIRELEQIHGALDEVYRRVVTSEYAEAVGIEVVRARPTKADTRLNTGAGQALLDTGVVGQDATIYEERRRRPSKFTWFAVSVLVLLLAGAGGVYGMLQPLPDTYRDDGGELGVVTHHGADALPIVKPIPALDVVNIRIDSAPRGADIYSTSGKVGVTPFTAARVKDSGTKVQFRILKVGFREVSFHAGLGGDVDKLVQLEANELTAVKPASTEPPATPSGTKEPVRAVTKRKKRPPKATPPKEKPVVGGTTAPVVKKKKNPFGTRAGDVK